MILKKRFSSSVFKVNFRSKHVWIEPKGHDTNIKIYNSIVKDKVPLIFPNKDHVTWYMCGPTVYDDPHVGHASCYLRLDIIRRILKEYFDIHPVVALGVTDLAEEIFKKANLLNKSFYVLTKVYTKEFFRQMKNLNILEPSITLSAMQHTKVMTSFIDLLMKRSAAYKGIDGNIYFSVNSDPNYGRFRPIPPAKSVTEVVEAKRNQLDFVLWKSTETCGFSKGIPGWHIECSAMASYAFGSSIDIHSGGSDLIFPHHENEEAQSTIYHKCNQWVNYWIHTGLVNIKSKKMSKSLGNSILISDYLRQHKSDYLRMCCFLSPYRADLNYDESTLQLAVSICDRVSQFLDVAEAYVRGQWSRGVIDESELIKELEKTKIQVKECLSDDFGTSEALKVVMTLIKLGNKMLNESGDSNTVSRSPGVVSGVTMYVRQFFRSFGFTFTDTAVKNESLCGIDKVISDAVDFRARARELSFKIKGNIARDAYLKHCDEFRDRLLKIGVAVSDTEPGRSFWTYKSHNETSLDDKKNLLKDVIDIVDWSRKKILEYNDKYLNDHKKIYEFVELCRYIKMYFKVLGISFHDNIYENVTWTFSSTEVNFPQVLEEVIHTALHFQMLVRNIAEEVPNDKKNELTCICDSLIADFDELGVKVNEKNQTFELENERGMSILNELLKLYIHSREQCLAIAHLTKDCTLRERLYRETGRSRKRLGSYGFFIMETTPCFLSSWKLKTNAVHKFVIKAVIDIIVHSLTELSICLRNVEDDVAKDVLLELVDSIIADLNSFGISVILSDKNEFTWIFEPSPFSTTFTNVCAPALDFYGLQT